MFKTTLLTVGLALTAAAPAMAFDLEKAKKTAILGLTGPTQGAKLKPQVIATQPLEAEGIASLAGRSLRTRFWEIGGPGGIVPIHEHSNRPAVFTVATGEIYEFSSTSKEPIVHKAGGLAMESGELAHWWWNKGGETVRLIAFDVQPVAKDFTAVKVSAKPPLMRFDMPTAKGAKHDLLGVVDLGEHFNDSYGKGYGLSTYRTVIKPGGVFPSFTGPGEPAQVFVWKGSVTEHRSGGAKPTVLKTCHGSNLAGGHSAWWQNNGKTDAVLYFGVVELMSEVKDIPRVGVLAHGSH